MNPDSPQEATTAVVAEDQWTTVIEPESKWFDLKLREVYRYRDLIFLFVRRDLVAQYKQTILGPFWFVIQPLLTSGVFTVIFGKVAKLPTDGLPPFLFYMGGNVAWNYFLRLLTSTSNTFTANAGLFGKVYFPRLSIPMASLFSGLIYFTIQFVLFLVVTGIFVFRGAAIQPNLWVLALPLLILLTAGLAIGFGIIISSATTKYRDLTQLLGFGTQLWMYATPIIYPLSTVPEKWRWLVLLNPVAPIIETFRYGFLGAGIVSPWHLAYSSCFTIVLLLGGILLFNRVERTFMDTV